MSRECSCIFGVCLFVFLLLLFFSLFLLIIKHWSGVTLIICTTPNESNVSQLLILNNLFVLLL